MSNSRGFSAPLSSEDVFVIDRILVYRKNGRRDPGRWVAPGERQFKGTARSSSAWASARILSTGSSVVSTLSTAVRRIAEYSAKLARTDCSDEKIGRPSLAASLITARCGYW